ncbi:MAG: transcriptional regulator [Novosphingobium sp. PASSN1]|nr:helix-turn-helix transcriptional regulator [Novosphingobium sp. PASSN1]OYU37388.1 MAG: transcriptional regulator [Novosphingobium sp. PASSN1]
MTCSAQTLGINARLARLLTAAVDRSGKSRREVARAASMNKDTFLRILRGDKAVTLDDAERVLDASGLPSNGALLLAILGHEDLAVEWLGEDAGAFLDQFLTALPVTMNETLGPRIADLRPRWAIGTSCLVARLLAKHIDDFAERDISLVLGR